MKLYSALIRLSGSLQNEVRKHNMTAAEIVLLRIIHGGEEHVREILHTANVKRTDAAERARLASIYSKTDPNGFISGEDLVMKYFGAPGVALPQEVQNPAPQIEPEDYSDEGEEITAIAEEVEPLEKPIKVERRGPGRPPRQDAVSELAS